MPEMVERAASSLECMRAFASACRRVTTHYVTSDADNDDDEEDGDDDHDDAADDE